MTGDPPSCEFNLQGKQAHIMDELNFLLEGIQGDNINDFRTSCSGLAMLCYRDHSNVGLLFRSHGLFTQIFDCLVDKADKEVERFTTIVSLFFLLKDSANIPFVTDKTITMLVQVYD